MNKSLTTEISAIILAAGFSSRMHDFKPLLPFADKTIIETVIDLFKTININDIIVVTGHNHNKLSPIVKKAGARPVFNSDFESGMLSSIQQGCRSISQASSGFFLLPVDIPAIRLSTVQLMVKEFLKSKTNIIMPCFDDLTGHPPLIPCGLMDEILNFDDKSTLRDLFISQKALIKPLKVFDRGILMDADDKNGYEKICQKHKTIDIPDKGECISIINEYLPDQYEKIHEHLKNVTKTALKIADAVTDDINKDLVCAGAMLHDIKRTEKSHAMAGAELIRDLGFDDVANVIAQHMDVIVAINSPIKEAEVVYFADKIQDRENINLNYGQRFEKNHKKFPHAKENILNRYENTKLIQARIEKSAGKPIKEIFKE
jgi:molybdenum cofactor cytidylyltransferase